MAKWSGSEAGILRKKMVPEKLEELLVFGYACKLFRDDEKALYVDQGKHLIPWMGDDKLRIDRYDCRGALSDLTPLESSREGYDAMRWLGLSESERKIEQLCDDERYYSLNTNEEEEEMYKEEELKRLQQKTNEFSYSYDVPQDPEAGTRTADLPAVEEEDQEYVPPPELHVPANIIIPKSVKENARIEKTALFVSKQGPQMEILIKAKQSDNPQFSFLNQADSLYKYYKHILSAIKAGSYKVEVAAKEEPKSDENEADINEGYYLHPSLQTSVQPQMLQVPIISYKPTADCTYSQLVNRIQGSSHTDGAAQNKPDAPHTVPNHNQMTYEQQQQYYQYYYAMQYYEYYKQMAAQFHSLGDSDGQNIPPHVQEQLNTQAIAFAQMAYTQYVQQNTSTNPYAQIVSNLSQVKDNMYPHQPTPTVQDLTQISDISKAPVIYSHEEIENIVPADPSTSAAVKVKEEPQAPKVETKLAAVDIVSVSEPKKALLSLAHYGSDSDDEESSENEGDANATLKTENESCKVPPDETKIIIDKMASYVSKNGTDFENIVRAKGDARFSFLEDAHEFHNYYRFKVAEFAGPCKAERKSKTESNSEANGLQHIKSKEKKIITPVSFSIKKPKEETPKDIKSALPVEESDEDESEETSTQSGQSNVASTIPDDSAMNNVNLNEIAVTLSETAAIIEQPPNEKVKKVDLLEKIEMITASIVDDPILEMIDLTDDIEERKDAKRAEDKIKDKLAAAAREKLALVSKDRALQLERKKKAAAFLKLKSVGSKSESKKGEKGNGDDKVLVISDTECMDEKLYRRSGSKTKDKYSKKKKQPESDSEEGEIKKHKKSSKKKRSHKRKRSKSRHESRSHQHKKSRKKRRRSNSHNSCGSTTS